MDTRRPGARALGAGEDPPDVLVPPTRPVGAWDRWGCYLVIVATVLLAYAPTLNNGFVSWDDDHYVYDNHQLHYNDGIRSIWFDVIKHSDKKFKRPDREDRVSHQYYPMVFTIYWIEFRFHVWFNGADPEKTISENIKDGKMTAMSFHAVSMAMHAFNAVLLIWCLRSLGFSNWVAWVATILFALHPLQVATVAWAAERKNIISLMFYLLALMSYVRMRRSGRWGWYWAALALFQAALFSKTVALTFPVMVFLTDRLLERERRWDPRLVLNSLLRVAPMLCMAALAAWTTILVEDRQRTIPLNDAQRPLVVGAVFWFYPFKLLFPLNLSPVYPLWKPSLNNVWWCLPLLGAVAAASLVIIFRRRFGQHALWALLFYFVTQGPMLGLKNINYFQFAFVADHYFYHGSIGLFVLLAMGVELIRRRVGPYRVVAPATSGLVLLAALACGVHSFRYCDTWTNGDTFWQRTLAMNPTCWPAYYNTGNARARAAGAVRDTDPDKYGELLREAAWYYRKTIDVHPEITQPYDQLLKISLDMQDWNQAWEVLQLALSRWSHLFRYNYHAGFVLMNLGRPSEAIPYFQRAIQIEPRHRYARLYLGQCYAMLGDYCQAAESAERGNAIEPFSEDTQKTIGRWREACAQGKSRSQSQPATAP